MGSGWRPKSNRMIASIGRKIVVSTHRKVGEAWRYVKEMEVRSAWLARERPLQKPRQQC